MAKQVEAGSKKDKRGWGIPRPLYICDIIRFQDSPLHAEVPALRWKILPK